MEEAIRIVNMYAHPVLAKVVTAFMKKKLHRVRDMFTNYVHYKLLRHAKVSKLSSIYISQNYVGLEFKYSGSYLYVLGLDNNKVFVNTMLASRLPIHTRIDATYADDIDIMILDDSAFFEALGYGYDCILQCIRALPWPNAPRAYPQWYRLQGDILLGVYDVGSKASIMYINYVRRGLMAGVATTLHRELAHRIQQILSDHGIGSSIMANSNQGVVQFRGPKSLKQEHYLKLARLIANELYIEDIDESMHEVAARSMPRGVVFRLSEHIEAIISYDRKPIFDCYPLYAIRIAADLDLIHRLADDLAHTVKPEVGEREVRYGRHTIHYRGYPTSLVVQWQPPFKVTHTATPIVLPVTASILYIDSGKLTITHPEHGENSYDVIMPIAGEITSTHSNEHFEARSNGWAIKLLPVEPLSIEEEVSPW